MERIASLDDIPRGGLVFTYRDGPLEHEGLLVRLDDGSVRAWVNECRHLPLQLDGREPGEFMSPDGRLLVCSHHGALYRPRDGLCISGPCRGSHLRQLAVTVVGGDVLLDTARHRPFFDV